MGRKAERSGVSPLGKDRIRFNFEFEGKRYRPSIERAPTEGNLNRALKQLDGTEHVNGFETRETKYLKDRG